MNLKLFFQVSIVILVILAFLGFSGETIDKIAYLLYAVILPSIIFSGIIGSIIESFNGGLLKDISLNFEIYGINFSVTAFTLTIIIIKVFILR